MKNIYVLFFLLFSLSVFSQEIAFEKEVLNAPIQHKKELLSSFTLTETPKYMPRKTSRKVILENGYAKYALKNGADWLGLKQDNVAVEIDIIYTKYPYKKEDWRTEYHGLLANRLKALFELDPSLNDLDITWNIILQTECHTERQTKTMFHGIAIHYVPKREIEVEKAILEDTLEVNDKIVLEVLPDDELETEVEWNENEADNGEVLDKLKSNLPPDVLKKLEGKTEEEVVDLIYEYWTNTVIEKEVITPDFLKNRSQKVEKFIKEHSDMPHPEIEKMLNRQRLAANTLVVMDWTGSMYGFGGEVMKWHLLNFEKSKIQYFVLFNDGDTKPTYAKKIGETGGIYTSEATNIDELLNLFELVMARGRGGERPENDVEAILEGLKKYPKTKEVVLIADNGSCVRDIELANRISVPVKVILCGYNDLYGANPQYIEIAARTGGSVHTASQDIDNLTIDLLADKEDLAVQRNDKTVITIRSECALEYGSREWIKRRADPEPDFMRKVYYSMRQAMEKPDSVYRLNLATNNLDDVPNEINLLANLHHADFSYNHLTKISAEVYNSLDLESLDLKKNEITTIPKKLYELRTLEKLDISDNQIKKIPKGIADFTKLEELYLSNNELRKLSDDILDLRRLKIIDLSHNEITDMPEKGIGWRRVEKVDLSYNQLDRLTNFFKNCRHMTYFDASHNQLTAPPTMLVGMRHLNYLNLSFNQLTKIPSGLGNLKEVTKMDFSNNKIESLHARVGYATRLVTLDLSNNKLTSLPSTFAQLRKLTYLNLSGNPIDEKEQARIKKMLPNTKIVF